MIKSVSENMDSIKQIFGSFDEGAKQIESSFNVQLKLQEGCLQIFGEEKDIDLTITLIDKLDWLIKSGKKLDDVRLTNCIDLVKDDKADAIIDLELDTIAISHKGNHIKCRTLGQKYYVNSIKKNTITFAIGPAGTGKTFLAVALAVNAYKNKDIDRIILTRPAIEAGEKLGFLPGDIAQKVDPYLRPLYDALNDMIGLEHTTRLIERGVIEIAPLGFMRGRTLSDAFIILDEAQNTTPQQMQMFLTRLGENSKMVITGDITQIDLPVGASNGLSHASNILKEIKGIGICTLTQKDVVRHSLVSKIIQAYSEENSKNYENR